MASSNGKLHSRNFEGRIYTGLIIAGAVMVIIGLPLGQYLWSASNGTNLNAKTFGDNLFGWGIIFVVLGFILRWVKATFWRGL